MPRRISLLHVGKACGESHVSDVSGDRGVRGGASAECGLGRLSLVPDHYVQSVWGARVCSLAAPLRVPIERNAAKLVLWQFWPTTCRLRRGTEVCRRLELLATSGTSFLAPSPLRPRAPVPPSRDAADSVGIGLGPHPRRCVVGGRATFGGRQQRRGQRRRQRLRVLPEASHRPLGLLPAPHLRILRAGGAPTGGGRRTAWSRRLVGDTVAGWRSRWCGAFRCIFVCVSGEIG